MKPFIPYVICKRTEEEGHYCNSEMCKMASVEKSRAQHHSRSPIGLSAHVEASLKVLVAFVNQTSSHYSAQFLIKQLHVFRLQCGICPEISDKMSTN